MCGACVDGNLRSNDLPRVTGSTKGCCCRRPQVPDSSIPGSGCKHARRRLAPQRNCSPHTPSPCLSSYRCGSCAPRPRQRGLRAQQRRCSGLGRLPVAALSGPTGSCTDEEEGTCDEASHERGEHERLPLPPEPRNETDAGKDQNDAQVDKDERRLRVQVAEVAEPYAGSWERPSS